MPSLYQSLRYILYERKFNGLTSPFRVLPDFLVIGVGRGGTTSLYHYMSQHPCITKSAYDEIGFFDDNFHLGLNWYRSMFPTKFHKEKIIKKYGKFLTYDVTPSYIRHPWIIKRILENLPNPKIIIILRNPVDRTYSHYQMSKRNGNEKRTFEDVIESDKINIQKNEHTPKNMNYFQTVVENSYLARSFYEEQLQIWFKHFPKNKFLIISTEELAFSTDKSLEKIFTFLGVSNHKIFDLTKQNKADYPQMNSDTRKMLLDYFRPFNEKLYLLLGYRLDWDK